MMGGTKLVRSAGIRKSNHTKVELTVDGKTYIKNEECPMLDSRYTDPNKEPSKITVSCDLSNKSYGNGAAVMASITVVCDQNEEAVQQAFLMASSIVTQEAKTALQEAENVFKEG